MLTRRSSPLAAAKRQIYSFSRGARELSLSLSPNQMFPSLILINGAFYLPVKYSSQRGDKLPPKPSPTRRLPPPDHQSEKILSFHF